MTNPAPTGPAPYTLDDLRSTIERKYGPFRIDMPDGPPVVFRPVLRLDSAGRARVFELIDELRTVQGEEDEPSDDPAAPEVAVATSAEELDNQVRILRDLLTLVAQGDDADRLFAALGPGSDDDLGVLLPLWEQYQDVTQPGEASPSES